MGQENQVFRGLLYNFICFFYKYDAANDKFLKRRKILGAYMKPFKEPTWTIPESQWVTTSLGMTQQNIGPNSITISDVIINSPI